MNFKRILLQSVLIWISVSLTGATFHWLVETTGLMLHETALLSLLFSFPALFFLVPNFYILGSLLKQRMRILYSIVSIILISLIVIAAFLAFTNGFPFPEGLLIKLLLPYILTAVASFFLFGRKYIVVKNSSTANSGILNRI